MRHRGKRRDANHFELMNHAKSIGFLVLDTSQLNAGLDLIVGLHSFMRRIEIKDGSKPPSERKLLASEQKAFDEWPGLCVVWESEADVDLLHTQLTDEWRRLLPF